MILLFLHLLTVSVRDYCIFQLSGIAPDSGPPKAVYLGNNMVPMMRYVILVCQSFGYDFNQMVTVFATIFFLVPPRFAFRAQFLGRHSSVFETSRRKLQQTDPKEERLYRETIRWSDAGRWQGFYDYAAIQELKRRPGLIVLSLEAISC